MKTKSKYVSKYDNIGEISSLSQLRQTRAMLSTDIRRSEKRMKKHYSNAMDMFSYKTLLCTLLNKADDLQAMVKYAMYGYDIVNGIIVSRRKKKGSCCD